MIRECVFHYGEQNRGMGILTLPRDLDDAPVVVMLNAGLLHRVEPYRLNVLAARRLAEIGYVVLRVDLSGKGDTPTREGLTNRESVALDWCLIRESLFHQFGERCVVMMGLCSGADNGIKIAAQDTAVRGLILMDAVSKKDAGFARRAFCKMVADFHFWLRLPKGLMRVLFRTAGGMGQPAATAMALRDEPRDEDLQKCFTNLVSMNGRVLAIFTSHAVSYYNQQGQFARALAIPGAAEICDEHYWPTVQHLYSVQRHRERLLAVISEWCEAHDHRFRLAESSSSDTVTSICTT